MDNRKKFILAMSLLLVITIGIVTFAVTSNNSSEEEPDRNAPVIKTDYVLTESDKNELKLMAESVVDAGGSYGWPQETLLNPTNLNLTKSSDSNSFTVFRNLNHISPEDSVKKLNKLSENSYYSKLVNTTISSTPFSIKTELTNELTFPEEVYRFNGFNTVEVTAPIKTELSYVAEDYNYRDDEGNLITGGVRYENLTFEGTVSITFYQKTGRWVLENFNETVYVFSTDKTFSFPDSQFASSQAMPIKYTLQDVNDDGSLGEARDNLPKFKESLSDSTANELPITDGE